MHFDVVVSGYEEEFTFHFYDDMEKVKEFCRQIIESSDYFVKIIPILIEEEKEE